MSTLDPMEERAAATILVEATDPAVAAADPRVSAFLQGCSELLGREAASIMDLRWRGELDSNEVSTRLSIPVEWVDDQVAILPALFGNMVRSRILWFGGQPMHDELADQLAAADMTSFDATTSRSILAHARTCEICDTNTTMSIEPIVAFRMSTPPAGLDLPAPPPAAPPTEETPTSAAAARIAAATAAGSAAAAATAGSGAAMTGAMAQPATPTGPTPPVGARHAPVGGTGPDEEEQRKKRLLIGGIAAAVVVVLLIGFLLTRGGSGNDVATGESPTTVENKVYQSTSSTASTTTTTRPPTTTTTAAPLVPDSIAATMNGGLSATVVQGFPTASANLAWVTTVGPLPPPPPSNGGESSVTVPIERHVEVSGPGITQSRQPENGSIAVCPSAEPEICNVVPGAYDYTVTLFVNGESKATSTVTLVVDPPAPPPAPPGP